MAAIIDNFKGEITEAVTSLLEMNNVHVCLLPANTTDLLQPMDIAVNKPAKDFLCEKFQQWYSQQVLKLLMTSLTLRSYSLLTWACQP